MESQMPRHSRTDAVLDVIDHVYGALLDPGRWRVALTAFAALVGARAAGVRSERVGRGVHQQWVGLDASFERAYLAHYWQDDPWAARIWSGGVGQFSHGDGLVPRAVVEASAYHNELALPGGFDDLVGGILSRADGRVITLASMRESGRPRFDAEDARIASLVAPHFERALVLRERLEASQGGHGWTRTDDAGALPSRAEVEARLRTTYGLTVAEARVATLVGTGRSPKEIAARQGTSWNTVRAQLRSIFAKTGHRSQSALSRTVTLLEAGVAADQALSRRR